MADLKSILQDIVVHTHSIGFLPLVKITSDTSTGTILDSMAEDRTVVLSAKFHDVVSDFEGVFGMPNLEKLALHLKNPEYKENANIKVTTSKRDGVEIPENLHFENESGDFRNEYRLMAPELINEKMKIPVFRGAKWDIEFTPSLESIRRLKLQAQANSEEDNFRVSCEHSNLVVSFGSVATHAGSFVFQPNIDKPLKRTLSWPVDQVVSILNLDGDKTVYISDAGAMKISVDSGLALYDYILPANMG